MLRRNQSSVYCPTSSLIRQCHRISLPQLVPYVYGDDWCELLRCIPLRVRHPPASAHDHIEHLASKHHHGGRYTTIAITMVTQRIQP